MNLFQALKEINRITKSLQAGEINYNTARYLKAKDGGYCDIKDDVHALGFVVGEYPVLADRAFKILSFGLQQDKVINRNSIENVYYCLESIVKSKSSLADDVFDAFKAVLQSNKNYYYSMGRAFSSLGYILDEQPKLAGKVLECIKIGLKSNKNDAESNKSAYWLLMRIIKENPELEDKVFNLIKENIQSNEDHSPPMSLTYLSLTELVIDRVDLKDKAFELFKTALRSDKNNATSLSHAYRHLTGGIIGQYPQLKEKVFEIIDLAVQSDKNEGYSYEDLYTDFYKLLNQMVTGQSELIDPIIHTLQISLNTDKNDDDSLEKVYVLLGKMCQIQHSSVDRVLDLFEKTLQSAKNSTASFKKAYTVLASIFREHPELADKILQLVKVGLKSGKNNHDSLKEGYRILESICEDKQTFAENVYQIIESSFQSNCSGNNALTEGYKVLGCIAQAEPTLAEKILKIIETSFKTDRYDIYAFRNGSDALVNILHARPDMANSVLNVVHKELQSNRYTDTYALGCVPNLLMSVVESQPALVDKVFEMTVSCENLPNKIFVYRKCAKHISISEKIAFHPEIEQDLQLVNKARFSNDKEFQYALDHFDKQDLANSNIFSGQHKVMNVLVSLAGQGAGLEKEALEAFRRPDADVKVKDYVKDNEAWLISASFNGAAIFGAYFPTYIKTIQNHNQKNPSDKLSIHDAVYWLPEPMSKEANARFANFIQKNIIYQTVDEEGNHKNVHRPLEELQIISQNWKTVEKRLQKGDLEIGKLKYQDILSICRSVKYENQRHDEFAAEAAKHAVSEAQYHDYEDIYLAGLKVPEPFDSTKRFQVGKYVGRFLPRDDVRVGFFGNYTDCCQHFGPVAGHPCAVSTVKHPFSQLFVIEDDKGKIIAGSWTWENTEGKYREVCFDNIESLGELSERPELNKIYEQAGEYLTKEENCRRVTIGLGYQDADVSSYAQTEAISLPQLYGKDDSGSYSDARSQVLLAENKDAEPLDQTKESQCYIRDVCFLDEDAMYMISDKCFPDSDKELQIPENMSGFVIEDRQKGVVGYVLYDKEKKEIYDMAVLPEYRKDKNASSGKLLLEMIKIIQQEGGEWKAELRDKTTLRYMEAMVARGVVKLQKNGVDHEMSDGSKVVAVTFEPIPEKVRQAASRVIEKVAKEPKSNEEDSLTTDPKDGFVPPIPPHGRDL